MQNDFAARADWCVKSYEEANHAPVVMLAHEADMQAEEGSRICLSAEGTKDPDGDKLTYRWWQYQEAGTYGNVLTCKMQMINVFGCRFHLISKKVKPFI